MPTPAIMGICCGPTIVSSAAGIRFVQIFGPKANSVAVTRVCMRMNELINTLRPIPAANIIKITLGGILVNRGMTKKAAVERNVNGPRNGMS